LEVLKEMNLAVDSDGRDASELKTLCLCMLQIESNPIMGFLLKAHAGACWQVYVRNSKGTSNGYGDPFG
jgi:hypothetical protein